MNKYNQLRHITFLVIAFSMPYLTWAHGDEVATTAKASADHFTVYGRSEKYELTLYYPELTAGQEGHLKLFVADNNTNRPIENAKFKVSTIETNAATFEIVPVAPGIYEIHAVFPESKKYTLNLEIAHPNGADLIGIANVDVGRKLTEVVPTPAPASTFSGWWFAGGLLLGGLLTWLITRKRNSGLTALFFVASAWFSNTSVNPVFGHGDDEHGPKSSGYGTGTTVFVPKETQFLFDILTLPVNTGEYHSATTMYGTVIPAANGLGAVVSPQNGRITRLQVAVGQTVKAGQIIGYLRQNIGTPDQVNMAANNSNLTVQLETIKSKVAATERELNRLKKIADIAAARDVQAAEAAYNAALSELQTLENKSITQNTTANNRTIALVAPISGVVSAFTLTAGAEVIAGQQLLTITNLNKVYVEAQVYDRDLSVVHTGNKFTVQCSTDDHKSAEIRLIAQAQMMNPGNQSQRVLFELDNPKGEFKIGEFVTVKALDNSATRQISVPNSALTEINGKTAIFIKHAPEEYEIAYIQTGTDDGTHTLILKGFTEGEKVVINGTYEVKMMYLNL